MHLFAAWKRLDRSTKLATLWNATLAAIVVILLVINTFPPKMTGYTNYGFVLASEARLIELSKHPIVSDNVVVKGIKTLRPASQIAAASEAAGGPKLLAPVARDPSPSLSPPRHWIAEIVCVSQTPMTRESLQSALMDATSKAVVSKPDTEVAKQLRGVRWQVAALEHSIEQAKRESPTLVGTQAFQLASHSANRGAEDLSKLTDELDAEVLRSKEELQRLFAIQESELMAAAGQMSLARTMTSRPTSGRISIEYASIILCFGFVSYAAVAWIYLSIRSRRVPSPNEVAKWLSKNGIPTLGSLSVMGKREQSVDRRDSVPRLARWMTQAFEMSLLMFLVACCLRVAVDSQWRALASDNLLFALGRVLFGL
jgi:hypothetical protein